MYTQLTLSDRIDIEVGLKKGDSLQKIANDMGVNRSTIAREIQRNKSVSHSPRANDCIHRHSCNISEVCSSRSNCLCNFRRCGNKCQVCTDSCDRFEHEYCPRWDKSPFVCNGCKDFNKCILRKISYVAKYAQQHTDFVRSDSRKGISLSETELEEIDKIISPAVKKGQSIAIVCENHKDEISVSSRTVYSYLKAGIFTADNADLRRKIIRKSREKSGPVKKVDLKCHIGRTYEDYLSFMNDHSDTPVVQIDSVIGKKGGKVLLTIFFCNCDLQLMYIRDRNNAASVSAIFRHLFDILGSDNYQKMFPVVLTDRGAEFTDPSKIENPSGADLQSSHVFYCDPMNSNQKSNCERNHEFIRYIIPKGTSIDQLTQYDIDKMVNHINSYGRKKWNNRSPLDIFLQIYSQEIASSLGLQRVPADSINLTPSLLK